MHKEREGRLSFIEEDRAKIWKEYKEKIMNEKNEWDHMIKINVVKGPVEKVASNEIVKAMQKMKSGKATGLSEVSVVMIVASGEIEVKVMMKVSVFIEWWKGMPESGKLV